MTIILKSVLWVLHCLFIDRQDRVTGNSQVVVVNNKFYKQFWIFLGLLIFLNDIATDPVKSEDLSWWLDVKYMTILEGHNFGLQNIVLFFSNAEKNVGR